MGRLTAEGGKKKAGVKFCRGREIVENGTSGAENLSPGVFFHEEFDFDVERV